MMPSAAGSRTRALHRTQARASAPRWIRCARPEWLPPLFCLRLILLRSPWRPHSRLATSTRHRLLDPRPMPASQYCRLASEPTSRRRRRDYERSVPRHPGRLSRSDRESLPGPGYPAAPTTCEIRPLAAGRIRPETRVQQPFHCLAWGNATSYSSAPQHIPPASLASSVRSKAEARHLCHASILNLLPLRRRQAAWILWVPARE